MADTIRKNKLTLKITIGFLLVMVILLIIFKSEKYANGADSTPSVSPSILPIPYSGCDNHGGVNCSVLNPDASVTCNDGTVDQSAFIYAVTQCQQTIDNINRQGSAFMNTSGCIPPGEMGCISEQSHKNLSTKLASLGVLNSELGKSELAQCRQQIQAYSTKNNDYKQCLAEHDNPQFNLPSNRLFQPIFKAIFCPIFYGEHTTYDYDSDLCLCDNGYFLSGDKCTNASSICQTKYGSNAYAQNGNCVKPPYTPIATPSAKPISIQPQTIYTPLSVNPSPTLTIELRPTPNKTPALNQPSTEKDSAKISPNFVTKFFNSILSTLKNILKL